MVCPPDLKNQKEYGVPLSDFNSPTEFKSAITGIIKRNARKHIVRIEYGLGLTIVILR
jgi:hypothetical protein